jgi:HD-GYP domain-containing protein (c-di-GMP phosphodiesterase class II)/pSer/pThr/pTyr-binding forkhead associated (FHA) protein
MGRRRIRLAGVSPEVNGQSWESITFLRLGRLETLEVMLNDPSVSRRHAEIEFINQAWVVRDLGSTNGTFLNQVRVGRADQRLKQDDILQFGNLVVRVAVLEAEPEKTGETLSGSMRVECSTTHSWETALELCACEGMREPNSRDRLLSLFRIGRDFSQITSLEALLESVLQEAVLALKAQGGAILLLDETSAQLLPRAVLPREREFRGQCYSVSLAQRTLRQGESLLSHDIRGDLDTGLLQLLADGSPTSVICALLRTPQRRLGALHVDRGPKQPPFTQEDLRLADALAASMSSVIASVGSLLERERELLVRTLTALAQAVELRDDYTGSHTQRVTDYALMLAEELQVTPTERYHLQIGTPLHDIGKIGISDSILRKPSALTPEESEYMKTHTVKGAAMIETIPHLAPVLPIVRNHHERWDGHGYPDGLRGQEIPLLARIVGVADAFDAMTTDRPYRRGLPVDVVFEQIQETAGEQFDPVCARAFLRLRPRIEDLLRQSRQMVETMTKSDLYREMKACRPGPSTRRRTVPIPKSAIAKVQQRLATA